MKNNNIVVTAPLAANDQDFDPDSPFDQIVHVFPEMADEEYEKLMLSIKKEGLLVPIVRKNGKIIDGRARYRVCVELGIKPEFKDIDPNISSVDHCVGLNLARRHLNDFDKVEVANNIGMLPLGSNQHTAGAARSQGTLAKLLDTSVDTLQRGNKILRNGSEELKKAVRRGDVSVTVGGLMAGLQKEKQDKLLKEGIKTAPQVMKALNLDKKQKFRADKAKLINELAANSPTFDGIKKHSVIYADPPWQYLGLDGTPYPTMELSEICEMKVKEVCTDDAVLFLWVTSAMLQDSFRVIEAWGFEYKTCAVWDKKKAGMGGYFRQQHELLLVATKGNPPFVDPTATPVSVISEEKRKHSEKPDCFYRIIEQMYPELDKLELFSRTSREGWTMWGNQAGDRDAA